MSLAERFNGEIINGDALQIYEGLPITTNKIPLEERKGIPHHLLGCVRLEKEPWSVRRFRERATTIIEEIRSRGRLPILVGGTHYYTQSILFRDALAEENEFDHTAPEMYQPEWPVLDASTEEMLEALRKADPAMATRWHPKDRRKIRRSLEIWLRTGMRASEMYEQQRQRKASIRFNKPCDKDNKNTLGDEFRYDPLILWTHTSSEILNTRLEKRVDAMISEGLLEEVGMMYKSLKDQERQGSVVDQSRGIWVAIGFKEFLPYFSNEETMEGLKLEGIERTKIATRQYAKSQVRWIRLRLLRALNTAKIDRRLFLLDATDIPEWSNNVEANAKNIVAAFLKRDELPDPRSLSDTAKKMLVIEEEERKLARYCEVCEKTLMSESEWIKHQKSKGHRSAMRPQIDWRKMYPKNGIT